MNFDKKVKTRIITNEILSFRTIGRTVGPNNSTSGKISLPHDLIGKDVLVYVVEQKPTKEAKK